MVSDWKKVLLKSGLFLSFIILVALTLNVKIKEINNFGRINCLNDYGIKMLEPVNNKLVNDNVFKKVLLIVSSMMIDLAIVSLLLYWMVYGDSWRFFFVAFKFYGLRAILQQLYQMPFPNNFAFSDPGLPSLTVSYAHTNDFFYSGHVGIPIICGLEFKKYGLNVIFFICLFVSLFEGFVMVSSRAHYGVDVIIGMIFAHYFFKITDKYIDYIDYSIFGFKTKEIKPLDSMNSYNSKYYL